MEVYQILLTLIMMTNQVMMNGQFELEMTNSQ